MQESSQIKVVKRYQNRKLYDTETSQYVTLTQIAEFVKQGRQVMVLDNLSKRDITAKTLLASLIETDVTIEDVLPLIKKGIAPTKV